VEHRQQKNKLCYGAVLVHLQVSCLGPVGGLTIKATIVNKFKVFLRNGKTIQLLLAVLWQVQLQITAKKLIMV